MSSLELKHKDSSQSIRHTGLSGGIASGVISNKAGHIMYVTNAASRAHEVAQTMRSSLRQVLFTHVLPCPAAWEWVVQAAPEGARAAAAAAVTIAGGDVAAAAAAGDAAAGKLASS